jgi:hypothetical protein
MLDTHTRNYSFKGNSQSVYLTSGILKKPLNICADNFTPT